MTRSPSFRNATSGVEQAVGADHDVDGAVGQAVDDLACLRGGEEARQHLDTDRVGRIAVGEGLEVLLGEQRRRHEDGGLVAVLHGLEDRPHRHLGLAEADVAAHEPVHRRRLLHVGLDVVDRLELVRGLRVGEGLLELGLPGRVGGEGVARLGLAAPVQLDQLLGDLTDGGTHPGLLAGPLPAAHPVERR